MTSTNDGKEVKNNITSGPKGKTYYIELYKSLESSLNESLPLPQRTVALCNAWRQVHSLCSHSAPSTHAHLLTWIQRHTATTVLQTEWRRETSLDQRQLLENAIDSFIAEAKAAIEGRGDQLPWEKQLVPRAEWFKKLSSDPWGHAVLLRILDQRGEQPNDDEVLGWLKEERGIVFVSRLRQLVASKCDDIALTLASAVMDRVRRTEIPIADYDDEEKPLVTSSNPTFGDIMRSAAGFSPDVFELLIDIEFVLLDKLEKRKTFIDLAKQTPLKLCYQLAERLRTRLDTSPKEKRLWKNAKHVATTIAQVSIARVMVRARCSGAARACLYWMARVLARVVGRAALPAAAAVLAAPAASARHLHTFTAALHAECADEMKPFICELYIRAITAGMNELERLKLKTEKDNETEARVQEALLASWFVSLGGVLSGSARIRAECDLTAFSLHPAPNNYERLRAQAPPPPLLQEKLEPKVESLSDFGSWANDSRANTNFVKTSETLNLKNTLQQINVVSTAILLEGEALGLSVELCQDLAVLLSGPRVKTFTWEMNREELLANCRAYMERTGGGTKALTTELKYLNLDPSQFQHLPEESDGEDDIYYGIEKGYESHLPEPERELEPEQIWAEILFDPEGHSSSESDTDDHGAKKKSKKPSVEIPEEQDPLSLHTETKQTDVQKKERQPSKERSKKPKTKKSTQHKEQGAELSAKEQEDKIKRDLIKKEKKEKKKQDKLVKALALSAHSINELVGVKVDQYDKTVLEAKTLKPYKERKKKTDGPDQKEKKERKGKQHKDGVVPTTLPTADTHGITLTSPEAGVVFDGLFSMDDLKTISPEKSTSESIINRSLSQPLPMLKPPAIVTETQNSTSVTEPEKKDTKEEIKLRIAKLLSFRKQRIKKISQHCANLKRLSNQFNSDVVVSMATSTTTSTIDLPPPAINLTTTTKATEIQIPSPNVFSKPLSHKDSISAPNISQYYRSPVNKSVNSIDTQTSPSPLRVQNNNNDNSQMNFRRETMQGLKPDCATIAKTQPAFSMDLPINNMDLPINNMANELSPFNRSLSGSRIPNILQRAQMPIQKTAEQKDKKQRNIDTPIGQPQSTNSSLNQQKVIRMKEFLSEMQQSLNAGTQADSNLSNLALMQGDKLKHDAVLNASLNATAIPITNRHITSCLNTKVITEPSANKTSTRPLDTKLIPVPAAKISSTGLLNKKVISVSAANRTGSAPQTINTSTKQKGSAPNTFSRLSYMHKNKLETKHNEGKLMSEKEAISNELERHIAEFKLAKLQQQHPGSLVVQRGNQKAVDNNPVLVNMLSSTHNKASFINQNKNAVLAKRPTNPTGSDGVLTNSAIDKELLNLFNQKAILNQTHLRPPTNHIVIKNDSQGPSFDVINVYDLKNFQRTTKPAATNNKLQNNNHVLTPLDALNATATVAKAPKSKRMAKPKNLKPSKGVLNTLSIIKPRIQKEMVQNVYQGKDAVTATFITKDKLKDPTKTEPEAQKQQNWASVMDQLRAHKTPSRGPNALNLALNTNKETTNATKQASAIKSSVIANVPMKQTCNLHISHDKSMNIKKETCSSKKERSEIKILKIQNFPVDQFRKHASKKEKSQDGVKKSEKPVIKPGSKLLLKNTSKPPINKQMVDEYALLEELIDRDLQQEIDELTSDEESNITPSDKAKNACKQNTKNVANQHISLSDSKASQAMYSNSRPTCSNIESIEKMQKSDRVNENAQQTYRQPSTTMTKPSSYIPVQNSIQNIMAQTYTITNKTNSNVVINVPVNVSNMIYVNPSVPSESYAIVQDTYILNSDPSVMLYQNSLSTPTNNTIYQNEVINKQPSAESVEKMSAAESLISMGMPRQAHVEVSPKVQAVNTKQNDVPELVPYSHLNTAEDALAIENFVIPTRALENATSAKVKCPPINAQNSYPNVNFAHLEAIEDIVSQTKENIRAAPLEKSASVLEILQKPHQDASLKRAPLDVERLATKRNNILNRVIYNKCGLEAIPLPYASLVFHKTNKDKAESNEVLPISEKEKNAPASEKIDGKVKEDKETMPCRRILLRSSNSLKAPQSTSKLTMTVKTAEPTEKIKGKRQRRSKVALPNKTIKKSPKNKKKTKQTKKQTELKAEKSCKETKPKGSIINELDFEEALTTSVIPKIIEESSSDNLSITDTSKKLFLASAEPDELTNNELKTYDCATDVVEKEDKAGTENRPSTELTHNIELEVLDPHDRLMQQNFTTQGVNLQVIRDIFDMDDDSSPISNQNEITNIVKEETVEPIETIPSIENTVSQSKTNYPLPCNKNIERSLSCNANEEEYLKSVIVTHLYTKTRGERLEKCVRVKLPNSKSFKVTVSGNADLDIKSLLSNPDVKRIIHSNWNEVKQFKLHVAHNNDNSKVLNAQEIRHCSETIDLLSDEEPAKPKENTMSFKTESGCFKIGSIDTTTHKTHQEKFLCKAFVNLIRHPNSFFEKSVSQHEGQQGYETETPALIISTPVMSENFEVNVLNTTNEHHKSNNSKNISDTINENNTNVECTDKSQESIEKHDSVIENNVQEVEKKELEHTAKNTINEFPCEKIDVASNNGRENVNQEVMSNDEVRTDSKIDEIQGETNINKLENVTFDKIKNKDSDSHVDESCACKTQDQLIKNDFKEVTYQGPESKNKNQADKNNVDVGICVSIDETQEKNNINTLKDVANGNEEVNSDVDNNSVSKTDVKEDEIQEPTYINKGDRESPRNENQDVKSNIEINHSKNGNQEVNSKTDLNCVSKMNEYQETKIKRLDNVTDNSKKSEIEVMSIVDASTVSLIDETRDSHHPSCSIEGTNVDNVNISDASGKISEIVAPKADKNFNIIGDEAAQSDVKIISEASKTSDKTDYELIDVSLNVKHCAEEIITRIEERVSESEFMIISESKTIDGIHKQLDIAGEIISISDDHKHCDMPNTNVIEVKKTEIAEEIERCQELVSVKTEQVIVSNILDTSLIKPKADAEIEIIAPLITQNIDIKNKAESIKETENLTELLCHESLRDLCPKNKVELTKKTEKLRGLSLDSVVVTASDYKKPTLSLSPYIEVLDNLNDQTVPNINRPSLAEKDKSKINPASSPILITEVIELEDSSNDSLDVIIPDISKILENKLHELKFDTTAPSKLAIDDLKSMLLDELGVLAKPTLALCEPIVLTSDEDEPMAIQQQKKPINATKKKSNNCTKKRPAKPRKKVTNVRQLIKEAKTRKCYVMLTRCDRKIPETILLDDDDTDEGVIQVSSDEINVNIEVSDDELTYTEPETTQRSESPSILKTLWPNPITEISLTTPGPLQLNKESYDGKTSPVMAIYDELASLVVLKSPVEILNIPLNCSAQWFETKRQIFRNAQCISEESCPVYNVSTLSHLVLKFITQTETLMSMRPKTKVCFIRRLNPVKRKIDVSYCSNKKIKMAIREVKPQDIKKTVPEQSIEEAAKILEIEGIIGTSNAEITENIEDYNIHLTQTPANQLLPETKSAETAELVQDLRFEELNNETFDEVVSSNNNMKTLIQTLEEPAVEKLITDNENLVESTDDNKPTTNEYENLHEKDVQHDVKKDDVIAIKPQIHLNNIGSVIQIHCLTEWFETKSILSREAKNAFEFNIYDNLLTTNCRESDNNVPDLTVFEHNYFSVDSTSESSHKEDNANSAINDNDCLVTGIKLSNPMTSSTNTPEVEIDGTFEIDNETNTMGSERNSLTHLCYEPIAIDIHKTVESPPVEKNVVETCMNNAIEIVESAIDVVTVEEVDLSNLENEIVESSNPSNMVESTELLSAHSNVTVGNESATVTTVGDFYKKDNIIVSDENTNSTEIVFSKDYDAEDDKTPLISPCDRSSNASNDVDIESTCSTPLSEDCIKGIEIEVPLIGKCYIFRPIGDSASDTDSLRNNDSHSVIHSESFNIGTESVYEIVNEYGDGDDSQNSTVDSINSPITPIQDEKEISPGQMSPKSLDNLVEDLHNIDYSVIPPKKTYLKNTFKRKLSMGDVKSPNKKYRKGKNIDTPKQASSSLADINYGKEYKKLMDYVDNLSFSYSIPFHKDYIETETTLQNWPTKDLASLHLISDDACTGKTGENNMLFVDIQEQATKKCDPIDQSLDEEMSQDIEYEIENSVDIQETNFKTGFGEGSGRVIQNFTRGGDHSKFSAAALSDVKQNQPILMSEDCKDKGLHKYKSSEEVNVSNKINMHLHYMSLRKKVKNFFDNIHKDLIYEESFKKQDYKHTDPLLRNVPGLYETNFLVPALNSQLVQVVQVGQPPVSVAAQNPVTCDPRVTQVSDASPSHCGDNSPGSENNESNLKAEYTELTNADLSMVNMNKHIAPMTESPQDEVNIHAEQSSTSPMFPHTDPPNNGSEPNIDNSVLENSNNQSNMVYQFERNEPEIVSQGNVSSSGFMSTTTTTTSQMALEIKPISSNGSSEKTDQIAHAMNAAGIAITTDANENESSVVNLISQNVVRPANTINVNTNNYQKTQLNTMSLQQALAQILPQSLNQSISNNGIQQNSHNNVGPQVLHIVQGKNANGNHITLLDNNPQTVLNASNATQVLHIVQNKSASSGTLSNGTPTVQPNSFGGLSLVDTGLQQGGNQLLHIVNTGAQKSQNANQLLKRVNLLTNLANVQGTNDQKMVQFVCKSADGKAIHLNAPQQPRMVLRLQPIENTVPATQAQNKVFQDESSVLHKDNIQPEMKTRSIYEDTYNKYVQENPNASPGPEKATSLPKFNQAFGKPLYQEGTSKDNEIDNSSMMQMSSSETDGKSLENNINLDQMGNPPLLLRQTSVPSSTSQTQQNIVQQLKQTIGPMNIQTMHGGVIYTRQIPVNLGGGQTINLITVPTTELVDESGQKQQNEKEPSIIKMVSQSQPQTTSASEGIEDSTTPTTNTENTGQSPQQTQPVLTHMRIKLPMLSKAPQMVGGARVVRPSFFQIQRNIIGGANQQVFQQYVLTTAPPLGQQTIRLPQAQVTRQVKVPTDQSSSESHLSSSTLEQLREFDMVLEQVKERSTVQPGTPNSYAKQADVTDSPNVSVGESLNQSIIYSIGNNQTVNVAYVTRKPSVLTPTTCTFVRSPDSTALDSPSTRHIIRSTNDSSAHNRIKSKIASKSMKSRPSKPPITTTNTIKMNPIPPKPSLQKPQEDEETTQRILYILNDYKEQVEKSPDKDKPAPRRRSNPPTNPSGSSKRKKGSGGSRRPGCNRDHSPVTGEDACRTMGSEDSSCGTSQGDCTENCSMETGSPQDSPRKVVRKLTFDQEGTLVTQSRPAPRNVIVADGQTITVARSNTPGKPATAVLMPSNYILPISMVKGGRQIAIVTNQGPKLLTVGGGTGEGSAANALLLQRLIGAQAGLKPVLGRPGVRHVRLPTSALQAFNLTPSVTSSATTTSISSPSSVPSELKSQASSSSWAERDSTKSDRTNMSDNEQWNIQTSSETQDYSYNTENVTSRSNNDNRTVLDSIPDRYSPDMEAQRIFDKMFDGDSKKSFADSHVESPRFDIQSDCDDRVYTQVVQRREGSSHGLHRVTHISAAALRHKYAMLEHELKLQKSLSEECEDLGVDSPSASELFPEAELLFAASPAAHDDHAAGTTSHAVPAQVVNQPAVPIRDLEDQLAAEHLLSVRDSGHHGLTGLRLSVGCKDTRPSRIDHEEFARSHPNTTFHTEPTDDVTQVQPYTIATGIKSRHMTSTIFHAGGGPATVLMSGPQTVIAQTHQDAHSLPAVKYIDNDADIDNIINLPASQSEGDLTNLVRDDGLTRYDMLSDRELHLSNTASAIVHASGAQVIKRVCYDDDKRSFLMDETDIIAGNDAKMAVAGEDSRDAVLEPIVPDDDRSSPDRPELFWESNSASERSVKQLDYSSDSEKCCKSPSLDETNSTDSSGIGSHVRLDSVIKEARSRDRCGSIDGSSADDTLHPPLRTYPAKRSFHSEQERSLSGKTRAGECPDSPEVRRRSSIRGVVKRGCHCCNGSPTPSRKKPRQKKPAMDFNSN